MLRSASSRPCDRVRVLVAKKSMVPTTSPPTRIGRHTPDFTPARCAAGARTQSVTCGQVLDEDQVAGPPRPAGRPTPSLNDAARVTSRNSWPALPDSWTKCSVRSAGVRPAQ